MPVTIVDPRCALIVVDLQKGLVGALPAPVWDGVVERSRALVTAFRSGNHPIVIVTADGSAPGRTERNRHFDVPPGFADPLDELAPQPDDIVVVKQSWGAFTHNDLAARLRDLHVTHVVVVGVATSVGVESTARQAYEAGFNVTLATDAMADLSAEAHDHSIASVFPRLGETGLANDIIALLDGGLAGKAA
jgi:nicotinamidase-related amidase